MNASNELMEKGMQQAHDCSQQEYRENVTKMIEVEKKREKDYAMTQKFYEEEKKKIHV